MKTPMWICKECEQTFTRLWNATRHCNNKHYGTRECVILFREYLANKGNNIFLQRSDIYSENSYQLHYQKNLSFPEKINPLLETKYKRPLYSSADYLDKEILLYDKLDKIVPQYQQLENLLSHLPQPKRASFLGPILNDALNSENPTAFINNQLDEFRM